MKFTDIAKLALKNFSQRGLRSWLTVIGIIIGIAAVVSILSIGAGMQQVISTQLGGLGADIITVSPGFERALYGTLGGERTQSANQNPLTTKDIQAIKSVHGIESVMGIIAGRVNVSYLTQSARISVQGVDPLLWQEITGAELESGRYLTSVDRDAVLVGYRIANEVFKKPLTINSHINIEGRSFKIVGILKRSGQVLGVSVFDNQIIMPIEAARTIIKDIGTDEYSSILVKVSDTELVNEVAGEIEQTLIYSRHLTEQTKDFTVTSAQAIQERVSETLGTMNLFLAGIAAVSLLVGAIGIANTMYMSVMERTRQIGTLKALGATNFEIMKLFLFESVIIGFMGGLLGIFGGFIVSGLFSEIGIRMIGARGFGTNMTSITLITPQLVLFAIGFSVLIGTISGLLPARRAANLQPVEALRYE